MKIISQLVFLATLLMAATGCDSGSQSQLNIEDQPMAIESLLEAAKSYTVLTKEDGSIIYLVGENHYWRDKNYRDFNAAYEKSYRDVENLAKAKRIIFSSEVVGQEDELEFNYALEQKENIPASYSSLGDVYSDFSANPAKRLGVDAKIEEDLRSEFGSLIFKYLYHLKYNKIIYESFLKIETKSQMYQIIRAEMEKLEKLDAKIVNRHLVQIEESLVKEADAKFMAFTAKEFIAISKLHFQKFVATYASELPNTDAFIEDPVVNWRTWHAGAMELRDAYQAKRILDIVAQHPKKPCVVVIGEFHRFGVKKLLLQSREWRVNSEGVTPGQFNAPTSAKD